MNKTGNYTIEIYSDDKISIQEIYKDGKLYATVKAKKKAIKERIERMERKNRNKYDT